MHHNAFECRHPASCQVGYCQLDLSRMCLCLDCQAPTWNANVTFCNEPWPVFLKRTGILNEDLWGTEQVCLPLLFKNLKTNYCSVQFKMVSLRLERPIRAPSVSQKFSQHCLWNGSNVRLIDDGSLSSFQERLSSTSSFHASLLMEHNYQPEPVSK